MEQLFKKNLTIFQSSEALSFVIIIELKIIKYNIQGKYVNDLLGTQVIFHTFLQYSEGSRRKMKMVNYNFFLAYFNLNLVVT